RRGSPTSCHPRKVSGRRTSPSKDSESCSRSARPTNEPGFPSCPPLSRQAPPRRGHSPKGPSARTTDPTGGPAATAPDHLMLRLRELRTCYLSGRLRRHAEKK